MPTDARLLSVSEAARWLGVSETTVRRRVTDGSLPAVRLGPTERHPLRIDERELEEFVYGDPGEEAA